MEERIERAEIDIVERAENVMKALKDESDGNGSKQYGGNRPVKMITVSQIRKFLTAVNSLTDKVERYKVMHLRKGEQVLELSMDLAAEVKYLKVKLAYQSGREPSVKAFEREAGLLKEISSIGRDLNKYMNFARYVEALVAYHKYYGGKD